MKNFGGILIMPSSQNVESVKNVLSIMFDRKCMEREKLPLVNKVLFIESDNFNKNGEPKYRNLLSQLKLDNIEIRSKKITNSVKDIPPLIMSAVREVGPENIILDLTCGLKDLTGSLYTAAIISGIDSITYTSVRSKPKEDGGGFYDLSEIENKFEYCSLKRFGSLDELEALAAMNNIEFIAYRQMIGELKACYPSSEILEFYCSTLESAVDYYFNSNRNATLSCIQKIGVMNEHLIGEIAAIFKKQFSFVTDLSENRPYKTIEKCQKKYVELKRKANLTEEDSCNLNQLRTIFDYIPMLSCLIETIRSYRNMVSHEMVADVNREDAKLCIGIYFKILNAICKSNMGDILFMSSNHNEEV